MNIQLISVNYYFTFKFIKNIITIPHNMLSWCMNNAMIIKIKLKYFSIVVLKPYKISQK